MTCSDSCPPSIALPCTFKDCTWGGFTWRLDSTDSTEFDAVLSSAVFQLQTEAGAAALTLSSATAGQITIVNSAAREWVVRVEPRILDLDAGNYSFALQLTDADGVRQPWLTGTLTVKPDPIV